MGRASEENTSGRAAEAKVLKEDERSGNLQGVRRKRKPHGKLHGVQLKREPHGKLQGVQLR